ncbi:MAG: protease family protein [Sphingomonadales bacterium]|jgi:membrane protease YdiL (CAAX protease family)|nr:protease family protein [Sphingomonadales bacterium]
MPSLVLGSDRVLAPGRFLWLRALGWGLALFALVLLAGTAAALAVAWTGARLAGDRALILFSPGTSVGQLAYVAMVPATLAAYAGLVRFGERRAVSELALDLAAVVEIQIGLALGAAMMAVAVALLLIAGAATLAPQPVTSIWNAVALSLQSGFVEEVLFRLVVLRLLWRAFGPWPALALSALLFGLLHLANPNSSWFAAIAIAVEAGIMLAAFYILTGRLWVSIGVHAGWNFTQGWLFGAAVSGTNDFFGGPLSLHPAAGMPQWLSGGAFGPEASFAGLLVGTAVGLFTLHLAWRRGRFRAG